MPTATFDRSSPDDLAHTIHQLHSLMTAAHRTLLAAVATYNRREAWRDDGATGMASWLAAELGITFHNAKEWVRMAEALEDLPAIAETFGDGRLSFDQTRHLTYLATPDKDEALAQDAPMYSAAQIARLAYRARELAADDNEDEWRRGLYLRWDTGRRVLRLGGRLPAADGAVVQAALERIAAGSPESVSDEPHAARLADALVELASSDLAEDADADRATIVVHADASALTNGAGIAELQDGPRVAIDSALRISCDARWHVVADDVRGETVGIGRTSRTVPPWLLRSIRQRDRTCRFPGCGHLRWLHAHHLIHWARGGSTDADNLVLLCGYHHRLVHERGWRVVRKRNGRLCFVRPDGRPYEPSPRSLRPEIRERFLGGGEAHAPPETELGSDGAPPGFGRDAADTEWDTG